MTETESFFLRLVLACTVVIGAMMGYFRLERKLNAIEANICPPPEWRKPAPTRCGCAKLGRR